MMRDMAREESLHSINEASSNLPRRAFMAGLGIAGASFSTLLAACNESASQTTGGVGNPPNVQRLKAAFTNDDLTNTWCAQGKQVAEAWGRWFGVDITWYDGGGSVDQQIQALADIASKQWDFVAIQALGVDTLIDSVTQMINKGVSVIQMDTVIDSSNSTNITTFLGADNVYMGEVSSTALFEKMGGKGKVIMTEGPLSHTGAQGRTRGFYQALAKYPNIELLEHAPADWDVKKVAQLWENYLSEYQDIGGGFFHNDDMALAAVQVIQKAKRSISVSGIDAMPPAIQAVIDGTMVATVRNPSGRVHWGALVMGILASTGVKNIPKYILADGPVVTQENGPGLIFMEDQFLL